MDATLAMTLIIVPAILTLGGVFLAWKAKGVKASASLMALLFAVSFSGISAVCGLALWSYGRTVERNCEDGVVRSDGNRTMWNWALDELDAIDAGSVRARGQIVLEANLPPREKESCKVN